MNDQSVPFLKLNYEKFNGQFESYSLFDAGLSALGNGFLRLENLSLIWCFVVSSVGLISLAYRWWCSSDGGVMAIGV